MGETGYDEVVIEIDLESGSTYCEVPLELVSSGQHFLAQMTRGAGRSPSPADSVFLSLVVQNSFEVRSEPVRSHHTVAL